jgi:hypothetical protein
MAIDTRVGKVIDTLLGDTRSKDLVSAYFDPESTFAGELFDSMGTNAAHAVTRDDLLAVTLLDVRFGPRAARLLLEQRSEVITARLQKIDPTIRLWQASDALLDGDLDALLTLLKEVHGVGPVIAGKLLARKRPHLVPVVDAVVVRVLGPQPGGYWRAIRAALADDERRVRLTSLRPKVEGRLSILRMLDILLWMYGSESTSARNVRAGLGLPVTPRGA